MKRNIDGRRKMLDSSITKVRRILKILELIGPWLTWTDWRKLEKLNKARHKWCYSKDAAKSLLGLWQELSKSLFEIAQELPESPFDDTQFPFLGTFNRKRSHRNTVGLTLYRSSLELSELQEIIEGNVVHESSNSCVKNDQLPIWGNDKWLLITLTKDKDDVPPYYYLKYAAPEGLKIVVAGNVMANVLYSDDLTIHGMNVMSSDWAIEAINAVGRAAALGLSGLIVYNSDHSMLKVLEPFVSALQEQNDEAFSSPLEILEFRCMRAGYCGNVYNVTLDAMSEQFTLHKLCNLKYLQMCPMERLFDAEVSFKNGLFPSLTVFICDQHPLARTSTPVEQYQGLVDELALHCPDLRFLQISIEYFSACSRSSCQVLLKKLFVLILQCHTLSAVGDGFFPSNCEMRVITIACEDVHDELESYLRGFLSTIDRCLPMLVKLNIVAPKAICLSCPMQLKDLFRSKSIDLYFYHCRIISGEAFRCGNDTEESSSDDSDDDDNVFFCDYGHPDESDDDVSFGYDEEDEGLMLF